MKGIRLTLIGLQFMLMPVFLQAQILSLQATLSSDSIMIGDQIEYRLRVEAREGVDFQLPLISGTLSRTVEVLHPVSADTVRLDGQTIVDHAYRITSFEAGMQEIPAQEVVYSDGQMTGTAVSLPLYLAVSEPEVDTSSQIMPIKPPINTPLTLREALPWIGIGVTVWMLGSMVYALVWMYRRRKRDPDIFTMKPMEPAHVIALRELDRLKEEKLWEKGMVKEFYTRLTDITRHYIESQYGIPAMERTTHEILEAFRRSNPEDGILDEMLRELLELADLVKFAKEDPLPVDNQTNLNSAYLFVQKTYPLFHSEKTDATGEGPGEMEGSVQSEEEEVHGQH